MAPVTRPILHHGDHDDDFDDHNDDFNDHDDDFNDHFVAFYHVFGPPVYRATGHCKV